MNGSAPGLVWLDDCWQYEDDVAAELEAEREIEFVPLVEDDEWVPLAEADDLVPVADEDDGPEFAEAIEALRAEELAAWRELVGASPMLRLLPRKRLPAPVRQRGRSRAPRSRRTRTPRLTRAGPEDDPEEPPDLASPASGGCLGVPGERAA